MLRFLAVRAGCLSAVVLTACADVEAPEDPEVGGGGATSTTGTATSSSITSSTSTSGGVCTPGSFEACYSGPSNTEGVGACKSGSRTCAEDGSGFGDCVDEVLPTRESCATPEDDDCDGLANEEGTDCACVPGETTSCYTGAAGTLDVGICHAGTQTCNSDGLGFGACEDEVTPGIESCATPDDEDCDGLANEEGPNCVCVPGEIATCYTGPAATQGVGICQPGTHTCEPDGLTHGPCTDEVLPALETCATTDDEDCDGLANEEGTGCVCAPSAAVSCYDGPTETANVGQCATGLAQCSADGTLLGACVGQALPSTEYCVTPIDEDCDGDATTCTGTHVWSIGFSDGWIGAPRIDLDPAGDVVIGLGFEDTISLGGETFDRVEYPMPEPYSRDLLIAKLDAAGNHIWSRHFFGEWILEYGVLGMAVDADGNVIFTGGFHDGAYLSETLDFGGGPLTPDVDSFDIFVVKLDPDGNHVWSRSFPGPGFDLPWGLATDGAGNILITGEIGDAVDFGGGPVGPAGGFVVKLDAAGQHVFSKRFNALNEIYAKGIAVDATGNVALTGVFTGTTDFGGGVLTAASADVYVAKLDPLGNQLWSTRFGNSNTQLGRAIAFDANGSVVVTGDFHGAISFGGATLTSAGAEDIFLAKLDSAGNHLWSKRFGGLQPDNALALATDASSRVVLTGSTESTIDFGGGPLVSEWVDAYVAVFDSSGTHLWANRFGGLSKDFAQTVATDAFDAVYVAGHLMYGGPADFGGGPLVAHGYLAKLTE